MSSEAWYINFMIKFLFIKELHTNMLNHTKIVFLEHFMSTNYLLMILEMEVAKMTKLNGTYDYLLMDLLIIPIMIATHFILLTHTEIKVIMRKLLNSIRNESKLEDGLKRYGLVIMLLANVTKIWAKYQNPYFIG